MPTALTLRRLAAALLAAALGPGAAPVAAADGGSDRIVDELKVGLLEHDIALGADAIERGVDLNGELLFASPSFLSWAAAPRPHLGISINSNGNTNQAYFGLTWEWVLAHSLFGAADGLWLDGSLGGAVHDGHLDSAPVGEKRLGSRFEFRESLELGYQLTPVYSASLLLDHISNAGLATHNAGLTSAGFRFGFKF